MKVSLHLFLMLVFALTFAACGDDLPPPPPPPPADTGVDTGRPDTSMDASVDTEVADTSVDTVADANDDAAADASVDAADTALPDTSVDTGEEGQSVLFVGNSYTFYNDLPVMVQQIAAASGLAIEIDDATIGGAQLMTHWTGDTRNRVMTGGYDFVVMQGQSVEPVLARAGFLMHAELFADAIHEAGSEGVWFATWARQAGHEIYSATSLTPETMSEGLLSGYREAAAFHDDLLADIGTVWTEALETEPEAELFDADGSHPAPEGTLLAACGITRALIGGPPTLPAEIPLGIDRALAERLCALTP